MNIEEIVYNTTRMITNVEDKLSIAVVFLFCDKLGAEKLAELLYTDNHEIFIDDLNSEYSSYGVDFTIRFSNPNVKEGFYLTSMKSLKNMTQTVFIRRYLKKTHLRLLYVK